MTTAIKSTTRTATGTITTELPTIILTGPALSDLFFNTPHPHYDEHCTESGSYWGIPCWEALLKDANDFAYALNRPELAEQLVEDFKDRQ